MRAPISDDVLTEVELRTLPGFLGGYSGLTRDAYSLDLRQFVQWCHDRRTGLFAVTRGDIEAFARNFETLGLARNEVGAMLVAAGLAGARDHAAPA